MSNLSSNLQGVFLSKNKEKKEEWRLFNAKDFQSLMYPCFTICRILGVFPYKINTSTFEVSKLYYILPITIICIYNIAEIRALYRAPRFDLKEFLAICMKHSLRVLVNFIMIVPLILTGPRKRLFQTILKISRLPCKSYQKLSRLIHAKDIIGSLLIGLLSILTIIQTIPYLINLLFKLYIDLVVFQMDMLYMNCVCILKACFKGINDNLINLRELIATNNKPHVPILIYHEQRNPFLVVMELKALMKQHLTISDTVQMLNVIFSLQLYTTVLMFFSYITCDLYLYLLGWYNLFPANITSKGSYDFYFLSHMVQWFLKILLVVWACETSKDEAQQISTSIHEVFNSTTNEQIRDELQLFSLQVLHCNNTFSAKGFTMDAKLLTGVISSIVTYVIILFQFKSVSCKEKPANITEVI